MKAVIGQQPQSLRANEVSIPISGGVTLEGSLQIPPGARGIVLFAHGSGSSRHSPRNQFVARNLWDAGLGTLLFDLLTPQEEQHEDFTRTLCFDLELLARRLVEATRWLKRLPQAKSLSVGYFGSSTGGGAALMAAAELGDEIGAIVSRGGRPDLAGPALARVLSPTLLIVGERDEAVLRLNEQAFTRLRCRKELKIVPRATHLFEEAGALEQVARLAATWFKRNLAVRSISPP